MQVAITFEAASSASSEGPAQGRWTMVGNNEFSIAFRLAGDPSASSDLQYRVTGALKLDRTLGRLRGPISCDVLDASGSVIGTLEGAAKARRISLNHQPE